jgi:hypothetical protein
VNGTIQQLILVRPDGTPVRLADLGPVVRVLIFLRHLA